MLGAESFHAQWDKVTQDKARDALLALGAGRRDELRGMGKRGEVEPISHLIATARAGD